MSKPLANKIALVTGASKGIGASIAKHLAAAGATVIVNYATSAAGADKTVSEIAAAGGKASAIQGDFSKPADIERVFAQIRKEQGRLDVLVNSAGVYEFAPLEGTTPELFHRHFDLNVLGTLLASRGAVALMGPKGGAIINIGSVVGKMAAPMGSIYSATKGAIDSITVALSKELGARQIRVNAINPGLIETEGTSSAGILGSEFHDMALKGTPLGRVGRPEDIARIAVFLASDDSYWINGQQIAAAGGHTM
jgi:3-oxoacyl-[acyl-carrier protein] reductase